MLIVLENKFLFNHRPGHTVGYGPGEVEVPAEVGECALDAGKAKLPEAVKPKPKAKPKAKAKKSAPENKAK